MATMATLKQFMDHVHKNVFGGKMLFRHKYHCETLGVTIYCNEIVGFFCCICSDD